MRLVMFSFGCFCESVIRDAVGLFSFSQPQDIFYREGRGGGGVKVRGHCMRSKGRQSNGLGRMEGK